MSERLSELAAASEQWRAASLDGFERGKPSTVVTAILEVAPTGCKPLRMPATDGFVYWVKPQYNPHGQLSILSERVVAAVADYLGAPIADSILVTIPETMDGRYYSPDAGVLRAGTAHGSRIVPGDLLEDTRLLHIPKDGNRYRAPAFVALWEWCFGEDGQWLYNLAEDNQMWTFDHGVWIGGQGEWTIDGLMHTAGIFSRWPDSVKGMDASTFVELADRIDRCSVADVLRFVASVPLDWGFTEEELLTIGNWLYVRRGRVARSLRGHAADV